MFTDEICGLGMNTRMTLLGEMQKRMLQVFENVDHHPLLEQSDLFSYNCTNPTARYSLSHCLLIELFQLARQ